MLVDCLQRVGYSVASKERVVQSECVTGTVYQEQGVEEVSRSKQMRAEEQDAMRCPSFVLCSAVEDQRLSNLPLRHGRLLPF